MMKKIFSIALTGLPCSGKSEIGKILEKRAGFVRIPSDSVREKLFGDTHIKKINESQWKLVHVIYSVDRNALLLQGKSVVTESCPLDENLKRLTVYSSPYMKKFLKDKRLILDRYLIELSITKDEYRKRNDMKGRTDKESRDIGKLIADNWESVDKLSDDFGTVKVLRYPNNTMDDQKKILEHLGKIIGKPLI